eukprot:1157750-Pelagomonas_calceolata.AAC.14
MYLNPVYYLCLCLCTTCACVQRVLVLCCATPVSVNCLIVPVHCPCLCPKWMMKCVPRWAVSQVMVLPVTPTWTMKCVPRWAVSQVMVLPVTPTWTMKCVPRWAVSQVTVPPVTPRLPDVEVIPMVNGRSVLEEMPAGGLNLAHASSLLSLYMPTSTGILTLIVQPGLSHRGPLFWPPTSIPIAPGKAMCKHTTGMQRVCKQMGCIQPMYTHVGCLPIFYKNAVFGTIF